MQTNLRRSNLCTTARDRQCCCEVVTSDTRLTQIFNRVKFRMITARCRVELVNTISSRCNLLMPYALVTMPDNTELFEGVRQFVVCLGIDNSRGLTSKPGTFKYFSN